LPGKWVETLPKLLEAAGKLEDDSAYEGIGVGGRGADGVAVMVRFARLVCTLDVFDGF
jgi:hypothetical protein